MSTRVSPPPPPHLRLSFCYGVVAVLSFGSPPIGRIECKDLPRSVDCRSFRRGLPSLCKRRGPFFIPVNLALHHHVLVDVALGVAPCDVTEYQPEDSNLCCQLCPAGQYVFRPCRVNHTAGECRVCESGTFLAFPNGEPACQRCIQCRKGDQEVVAKCSPTSDRQCQCKNGSFYCNSVDCVENCLRCKRSWGTGVGPSCPPSSTDPRLPVVVETVQTHRQCPGVVLSPCNATSNTVCATETDRGRPENKRGSEFLVPWVTVSVILAVAVIVGIYWYKKKGVRVSYQPIVRLLKGRSDGPGGFPRRSNSQLETVRPEAPERDRPAPGTETQPAEEESLALMPKARPHPGPSGEPEESPELQALVVGGSPVVQEQTLEASAPAAPEPQDGTQASPSLKSLEERYKTEYFVKDNSKEATTSIHYEFVKSSTGNDWKMFMRLIGLDETDIDSCECENPGNLMEQRHKMLFTWRKKLGKDASVFKLLAALHKLGLQMYLQNIINNLVAEGILGRHVGTSD
ncbi:tumor necrosis factor receptor superfamily member 10B-like isoform X3 [Prionailurus bengalensis]|uniref:tumor necrosis factor receptor superfamily member 10B-like isoform X3 n=1 Tax=Prionailurus bengalensis TaxID=37029 RepID=UPI001CA7DEA0|nr:tumor necrosis factor receptor superfamily member 10B-like isoform X3 [Prionailurus bengalensis]